MTKLISNLVIYPENMTRNLNITRGLIFSQTVLLKLVDKGITRENAYKLVQDVAMKVWADQQLTFFHELNKSVEIKKYLSEIELKEIFDNKKMLNNVNFIFARTIEAD